MPEIVYFLFSWGNCGFSGYLYYGFCSKFLDYRIEKRMDRGVIMAVGMTILFVANHLQLSFFNFVVSFVVCFVTCSVIFSGNIKSKIFVILTAWFLIVGCEFLGSVLLGAGGGAGTIADGADDSEVMYNILIIKMLTFVVFKSLGGMILREKKEVTEFKSSHLFHCFPIISLMVYMAIWYSDIDLTVRTGSNYFILFSCILLFLSNIMLVVVHEHMIDMMNQVRAHELNDMKNNLNILHYQKIEEVKEMQRKLLHNMSDYLKTIELLVREDKNEDLRRFIQSVQIAILDGKKKNIVVIHF